MEKIRLETKNVSMEFPGVKALSNVNFSIETGCIHAVLGANGAGKSTLMKVLAGANPGYTGEIFYDGKPIELRKPVDAKKIGIQIVYQEVDTALIPSLTVAENVMFNYVVMNMGKKQFMNWGFIRNEAKKVLSRLNIELDLGALVSTLSLAQKQMVLIARAIQSSCNFLILDEPTAPLSDTETEELFKLCRHLISTENIAIIFISHRIHEVLQICSSYTVMRNGEIVDYSPITAETTTKEIVEKMLGRSFEETFAKTPVPIGEKIFEVTNLSDTEGKVNDVSLYVRRGEIVGIAGLVGAGKTELCKTIFGAMRKSGGTVKLNGQALKIKNPSDAVKQGIGLVPEERRKEGVLVSENVDFNLSAASLSQFCNMAFINRSKTRTNANKFVESLSIKTPSVFQMVRNLSGGNQQKVAVGKWLAADCDVYLFDEPTKGVDVGAKAEIFKLINDIAKEQNCVIYASCENSELLSITDRIYVMFDGKIMAELETKKTSEDEIMHYAVGSTDPYKPNNEGGQK
ncbi:MAG: sugar ABC transporter ATP-binding protein [Spirochaetes bacterium]|uniref:Sugar ABC transporter ATP-binding protein n=1 Tax=Candidatus Ornithospirochaeta stercoripullorum TaxID=2840899 RepID=A0A9D9H4N2_9SPIO|nr:sugar ABC transporter ATP-binding protein [Candidatus Ornithospirochaeta stercoripullorum]